MDDAVWAPTTFTKNRDSLLDGDIAAAFFDAILIHADTERLLSDEHFTVDGTLLEAWASQKSFRPRDQEPPADGGGNPTVNFHGQRRTNATHQSTTDPDARLYKKARGREARLGYRGHRTRRSHVAPARAVRWCAFGGGGARAHGSNSQRNCDLTGLRSVPVYERHLRALRLIYIASGLGTLPLLRCVSVLTANTERSPARLAVGVRRGCSNPA
jgi:hypothetical protein